MATFLLSVMGAFAEFERSLIRERQREGITLAKKAGVYKGRGKALTAEQAAALISRPTSVVVPQVLLLAVHVAQLVALG